MRNIFVVILSVCTLNAFSQKKDIHETNGACTKTQHIPFERRSMFFPFRQSEQIKLVAFRNKNPEDIPGSELQAYLDKIKIGITNFSENDFDEVATLDSVAIDALTDIIYNYSYKKEPYSSHDTACYEPRNAIIFTDGQSKIIAFIELCFGCDKFRSSHKELDLGKYCINKFDLLKEIFAKSNIKFGITTEE